MTEEEKPEGWHIRDLQARQKQKEALEEGVDTAHQPLIASILQVREHIETLLNTLDERVPRSAYFLSNTDSFAINPAGIADEKIQEIVSKAANFIEHFTDTLLNDDKKSREALTGRVNDALLGVLRNSAQIIEELGTGEGLNAASGTLQLVDDLDKYKKACDKLEIHLGQGQNPS